MRKTRSFWSLRDYKLVLDTVEFFWGMFLGSAFANARTHLTDFDSDVGQILE